MFYTKPRVTVYIDDKAVGYKDWKTSIKKLKPNLIYEIKYSGMSWRQYQNYIKSLRLNKDFIGKIIGTDISLNATYVSNADKCYLIKERDKLNSINEIIENEQIDYVHAQPDSEVQFISKNSSQINAKTLNIKEELIKKYGNKEFTNQKWSEKFGSFETYSYIDILENNELFENCISKNGIAWVRKSYGAGSSGALPVNTIKQLHDWINY